LRRRGLWLLVAGSWLAFTALVMTLFVLSPHGLATVPGWRDIVRYNPLVSFPEFILGMALGLLFTRYGVDALPPLRRSSGPVFDALIVSALVVFGALLLAAARLNVPTLLVDTLAPVSAPPLAAIILLLAFQRGVIAALLSHPLVVWLGEISYGVYILHEPVWDLARVPLWVWLNAASLAITHHPADNLALFLAYTLVVIAIAGLSFQFLERPVRRAIRARWGQRAEIRAD
jgi:peptidoglycan/LPS O-acetylase OafA/YrhL